MKTPVVLIATPCLTGKVDINYTSSMLQTCDRLANAGVKHSYDFILGKKVDMARNIQVHHLLSDPQFTHILFVDDDMGWSADLALRLLRLNLDIVAVPARKRMEKEIYNLRHSATVNRLRDDLFEVEFIGTGIMLIKREVFEHLKPVVKYVDQMNNTLRIPAFFETGLVLKPDGSGSYDDQGEDVFFCRLANANGLKVYAYVDEDVGHCGDKIYVGNYARIVEKPEQKCVCPDQKEPLRILQSGA